MEFQKLSITLPVEMARAIEDRVSSGGYGSVSEVIREAMRAWAQREKQLADLDAAIAQGIVDLEAGKLLDIAAVRQELRVRLKAP